MKYGSVCSGIEAASVAWHPLGWKPAFYSEIEPFPSAVLAHRFPDVPNHGDMTKFKEWPDHAIDLLVGGTPCQSFSVAGLRKGLADPRGNLMLTYLAIARRNQPRWLVWENVPGVLSSSGGRDFGTFLRGLEELGYHAAWRVLDAQYVRVDGFTRAVPQRRRRVFLVGYLGDWRRAAAVLLEPESLRGNPAPRREAGEGTAAAVIKGAAIGREPENGPQYGEVLTDGSCYTLNCTKQHAVASTGQVSHCLNAGGMGRQDYETETLITHSLRGEGFDASEDGTGRGTPLVPVSGFDPNQVTSKTNRSTPTPGLCHTLPSTPNAPVAFDWYASQSQSLPIDEGLCPPLKTTMQPAVHEASAVRRLTPLECERLQGFPDGWTAITYRNKPAADGPRYKALGNSMAVNCMRWIGQRIEAVEALSRSAAA